VAKKNKAEPKTIVAKKNKVRELYLISRLYYNATDIYVEEKAQKKKSYIWSNNL